MTRKVITLEFVVPTLLAIALGIVLSIGAIHLTDKFFGLIDQAEAVSKAELAIQQQLARKKLRLLRPGEQS